MLSLRFEGVYYAARVWLNGIYLGEHEGYFSAFEFDVTDMVITDGENDLLVEVFSPEEADENARKTIGGVWARWDGMAPHINPGGIFKEVSLVVDGEVRIRSLAAAADHTGRGVAHVDLYSRYNTRARLVGRVRPLGFEAQGVEFEREVQVEVGKNRFEIGFRVPDVRVWSTWDRGEQPLYELVLSCDGAEDANTFRRQYRGAPGLEGLPQRGAYLPARDQLPALGRLPCQGNRGASARGCLPGA